MLDPKVTELADRMIKVQLEERQGDSGSYLPVLS